MKYLLLLLLAAPLMAEDFTLTIGNTRIIFDRDLCNYRMLNGDTPGQMAYTVGRVCTLPTKADWARNTGLDTTVIKPDNTRKTK